MAGINRQPSGFANLLQVQAGGTNPDNVSETVRPTLDIEPFYWPDRLRGIREPFNLAPGQADFIEVPEGDESGTATMDIAYGFRLPVPLILTAGQRIVLRNQSDDVAINPAGDFDILFVLLQRP